MAKESPQAPVFVPDYPSHTLAMSPSQYVLPRRVRPFFLLAKRHDMHGPCLACDLVCTFALDVVLYGGRELTRLFGDETPLPPSPSHAHQMMSAQPALVSRATFTKEKIALLCLMNMVFERHSQDRNIPFEEIAARTKLPVDQVCIYFVLNSTS